MILPEGYPERCEQCPMCGHRPEGKIVEKGDKWTRVCIVDDRPLSGRGVHQPNARCRCGKRWWESFYLSRPVNRYGRHYYAITPSRLKRYGLHEQTIFSQVEVVE